MTALSRIILALWSSEADHMGTHQAMLRALEAEYRSKDFDFLIRTIDQDDQRQDVARLLASGRIHGVHLEQAWGFDIASSHGSLFSQYGVPAVAFVRDDIHAPWLKMVRLGQVAWRALVHVDQGAQSALQKFGWTRPEKQQIAPHFYLPLQPNEPALPWQARPIDVLYVGSYRAPAYWDDLVRPFGTEAVDVLHAALALIPEDLWHPVWMFVDQALEEVGVSFDARGDAYASLVYAAGKAFEMRQRAALLKGLEGVPSTIVWKGPWPDGVGKHPETVVVSGSSFDETLHLMSQSKVMVMGNPPFSGGYSERLLSAAYRGVIPVTATTAAIAQSFRHGHTVLEVDNPQAVAAKVAYALRAGPVMSKQCEDFVRQWPEVSPSALVEKELALFNALRTHKGGMWA